jgi:hypothetical protein
MSSQWVDFTTVKESVSLKKVLDHYRIELRKVNHNSLRGQCPLPTHKPGKNSPSFAVNLSKNAWVCLSRSCIEGRGGKRGGNQLDLVCWMEGGCTVRDAALKLVEWFNVSSDTREASPATKTTPAKTSEELAAEKKGESEVTGDDASDTKNTPLSFTLKNITHEHPFLTLRGITKEIAADFGIGFFSGKGSMVNRIVIPIHNRAGELVAYAGRSIDESEPKYKFPNGFRKSLELFNLNWVLSVGRELVIVVEGFFDAVKVEEAGYPVVALMGSSLSQEQEDTLIEFSKVILMLDGDEAGREATQTIASRLMRRTFVKVISLPEGKQPDNLSSEELNILLGSP